MVISIFWATAPKGTKSFRTQGDFIRLFVHLSVTLSFLGSGPEGDEVL